MTESKLYAKMRRAEMRQNALHYRWVLVCDMYNGDWNGRIDAAMTWLKLAKYYRDT